MHRWHLHEVLGKGTFGTVYLARNAENPNVEVAVKRFHRAARWEECAEMQEMRSLVKLRGKQGVVQLLEVIRERDGTLFGVYELARGNLHQLIQMNGGLGERAAVGVARQILLGLRSLSESRIIHRDLKPENILVNSYFLRLYDAKAVTTTTMEKEECEAPPRVAIADFGSSCLEGSLKSRDTETYATTRFYRAPEMLCRCPRFDGKIDVWAAGCILFEMLSGRALFEGVNEQDMVLKICSVLGSPPPDFEPRYVGPTSQLHLPKTWPRRPFSRCFMAAAATGRGSSCRFSPAVVFNKRLTPPPSEDSVAIQLMERLLRWMPEERAAPGEILLSALALS